MSRPKCRTWPAAKGLTCQPRFVNDGLEVRLTKNDLAAVEDTNDLVTRGAVGSYLEQFYPS